MSEDNNNSNDGGNNNDLHRKKVFQSYLESHGKPKTRREFLASGAVPFVAGLAMPSWMHIFAKSGVAEAQDMAARCSTLGSGELPVFVQFKMNGGAAMSYNFLPHGQGGNMISSYSRIGGGLGLDLASSATRAFVNQAMFVRNSGMITGINSVTNINNVPLIETTLNRSAFVGLMVSSQDDSSMNKFGITGMVQKLGLKGNTLPSLGTDANPSGIAALPAIVDPSAPLNVGRLEDVEGAIGLDGVLSTLTVAQKEKLFQVISNLSNSQAAKLSKMTGGATLSKLMECAGYKNSQLMGAGSNNTIDPILNTNFSNIWGINANTSTSSQDYVFATMMYNACNGNTGAISFDVGGYDYHGNPRATTDARDLAAGRTIGRILQSLALMQRPGFIVVCSDGSVSSADSNQPNSNFVSDRGLSGAMYLIAYHPTRLPQVATDAQLGKASQQIGWLTEGQASESLINSTGANPERAAAAAFLNYVSFAGRPMSDFEAITKGIFRPDEIEARLLKIS